MKTRKISQIVRDDAPFMLRSGIFSKRNIEYVLEEVSRELYSMDCLYSDLELGMKSMIDRINERICKGHRKKELLEIKKRGFEEMLAKYRSGEEITIYGHAFQKPVTK
jgi:hypothetical protein